MKRPKIFIGFTEIAGYYANLKKGFNEIGIECIYFCLKEHKFNYVYKENNLFYKILKYLYIKRDGTNINFIKLLFHILIINIRLIAFIWSLLKFDVFIFNCQHSFFASSPLKKFQFIEFTILKLLNKKLIFIFHGSDTRPAYINGASIIINREKFELSELVFEQKKYIKLIERYADIIIHYPLTTQLHEKPIISHFHIGRTQIFDFNFQVEVTNIDKIKILHIPSDPIGKGTDEITATIENLKLMGYNIEFKKVTNKTHKEVIELISDSDLVIDQLYSDIPMSTIGAESSSLGIPYLIGSYAKDQISNLIKETKFPTGCICYPEELEKTIEYMINNPEYRKNLGKELKAFVTNYYGPKKVAERFIRLINDDFPNEWYFDPRSINYFLGYGASKEKQRKNLLEFIKQNGEKALQIEDKPILKKKIMDFVFQNSDV